LSGGAQRLRYGVCLPTARVHGSGVIAYRLEKAPMEPPPPPLPFPRTSASQPGQRGPRRPVGTQKGGWRGEGIGGIVGGGTGEADAVGLEGLEGAEVGEALHPA